jgi:hypothetical protein
VSTDAKEYLALSFYNFSEAPKLGS